MRRKSLLALLLVMTMLVGVFGAACAKKEDKVDTETDQKQDADNANKDDKQNADNADKQDADKTDDNSGQFEIALITDIGTIDDKSFNQGAWEGVEAYAKEHGKTYKYYQPVDKSTAEYISSIDLAVNNGAKLIVCPGFLFEVAVHTQQTKHPEVKFILLDGYPHVEGDYTPDIKENVHAIVYKEEQSGYLAGYAAVSDGYRKLGFMGGVAVPAVVKFGYGYVQGADAAAKDLGLAKDEVQIKYTYLGDFVPKPEFQSQAAAWYNEGTEVIFACAGGAGNSVMAAAEKANAKVIGVDIDQSSESECVITSATKNLKKSVYDAIGEFYDDKWKGGELFTLGAESGNVLLPMETSRFQTFDEAAYKELYEALKGDLEIAKDDIESVDAVPVELVKVELID